MQNVIAGTESLRDRHHVAELLRAQGYQLESDNPWGRLGCDFFAMNARAVEARYGAGKAGAAPTYEHRSTMVSRAQALKSAHCLRYQCSEGRVPEETLYLLLEQLIRIMERELVESIPAYQQATWNGDPSERAA